jgi:hypothetical protein
MVTSGDYRTTLGSAMPATTDREAIIHLAGRARLSPAVRAGAPALVPSGDVADRCGWATFFAALEARRLAVSFDPADPSAAQVVPAPVAPPGRGAGLPAALASARRFLAALRGRPKE